MACISIQAVENFARTMDISVYSFYCGGAAGRAFDEGWRVADYADILRGGAGDAAL